MGLSDIARSRVETEGDNSGFGPYSYSYQVIPSAPVETAFK